MTIEVRRTHKVGRRRETQSIVGSRTVNTSCWSWEMILVDDVLRNSKHGTPGTSVTGPPRKRPSNSMFGNSVLTKSTPCAPSSSLPSLPSSSHAVSSSPLRSSKLVGLVDIGRGKEELNLVALDDQLLVASAGRGGVSVPKYRLFVRRNAEPSIL